MKLFSKYVTTIMPQGHRQRKWLRWTDELP